MKTKKESGENHDGGKSILEDEIMNKGRDNQMRISEIARTEGVQYNFSRGIFGYGDDARDWENKGDVWKEVEDMDTHQDDPTIPVGMIRISFKETSSNLI